MHVPSATIRTQVSVPLRFADGYVTEARVFSFEGLVDDLEHLTFALGDYARIPLVRLHSECLTGDVFGSQRCDCGPQLREAVERIADSGGFCCTCGRRDVASACTPSSRPTRCRTWDWTPTKRTSRSVTARTSAATSPRRRCCRRSECRGSLCSATTRTRLGSSTAAG